MMKPESLDLDTICEYLIGDAGLMDNSLLLDLDGCSIRLHSNSDALLSRLRHYFRQVLSKEASNQSDMEVIAIERVALPPELDYIDWKREAGKKGRKDSYLDFPGGRLIRKVRTGMVFLQNENRRIAAGPCLQYDNQLINFINAQYMNWLQNHDWLICHAAALVYHNVALGMAGFSGGGKSTLMLHLLEHEAVSYLTNDRLFISAQGPVTRARGIPKLPRVNPGTIVHNPRLHALIPEAERRALLALPQQQLWELEDKYDVMIDEVYGSGKLCTKAVPLKHFLVLNWNRADDKPPALHQVDLTQRSDLLATIMKSPGPFYQLADGSFYQDDMPFDEQAYLDQLRNVAIYEVTGGVDFDALTQLCFSRLLD
jgi:HprK-related kinase B